MGRVKPTVVLGSRPDSPGPRFASAYLGKGRPFGLAIADPAVAHADQNERDYGGFVRAVESGRLEVERDT